MLQPLLPSRGRLLALRVCCPSCRYSHRHLSDLGYGAIDDVEEVRFFCNTSAHSRVIHFKTSNSHVQEVAFTGNHQGQNSPAHWNSGWTALPGHTAYLPAATRSTFQDAGFTEFPFYQNGAYHWGIRGNGAGGHRWECDDFAYAAYTTQHQVWVRHRTTPYSPPPPRCVPRPAVTAHRGFDPSPEPLSGARTVVSHLVAVCVPPGVACTQLPCPTTRPAKLRAYSST